MARVGQQCHHNKNVLNNMHIVLLWAGIAQSIKRLVTGWTVRGSNPGGV